MGSGNLISPAYVKPFVKRQKNDMADAEAIAEAASRPTMRVRGGEERGPAGGAVAVVRWATRKGAPEGSWLHRMPARKPKMLVAVALANCMARTAWALLRNGEDYRDPATAVA